MDVQLESAGTKKGISSTKLVLTKNKDLKSVLSEGEQKAVALALFIAEIKIQKTLNPIIPDDPVNSLDHKIAGKFAERLMYIVSIKLFGLRRVRGSIMLILTNTKSKIIHYSLYLKDKYIILTRINMKELSFTSMNHLLPIMKIM